MLPRRLLLGPVFAKFNIHRSFPPPNTGPQLLLQTMPFTSFPVMSDSLVGPRPLGFTKLNKKAWRQFTYPENNQIKLTLVFAGLGLQCKFLK